MPSLLLCFCLAASLITSTLAAGSIIFVNHCTYPIYFFEVGLGSAGEDHQFVTVPGQGFVSHQLKSTEGIESGISIKIRDVSEYRVAPAGILQAEYNLHPDTTGTLWYDLSIIDCKRGAEPTSPEFCPLILGGVKMYVPGHEDNGCRTALCSATGCKNTYLEPGPKPGDPTLSCHAGVDIHFETCINNNGPVTIVDKPDVSPPDASPPSQDPKDKGPEDKPYTHGPLQVSPNGLCGAESGFTCAGSAFGKCCSQYNHCGSDNKYCDNGCQKAFGSCGNPHKSAPNTLLTATKPRKSDI
ncbi:hypothetical protein J1614_006127 [Plenodomus biglobosus]|nr:hypothetical protein J1614_006127 [Plenodomus biglobosus]